MIRMRTEIRIFEGAPVGIAHFDEEMECISCAVLNGGVTKTHALFIMQVPKDYCTSSPAEDAMRVRDGLGLPQDAVGMMTAAEVDYVFNSATAEYGGTEVAAIATAGLSNHVVAGDVLDNWPYRHELSLARGRRMLGGTINIAVVSPVALTMEGKVNLMIPLVEGKTAALNAAGYYETGTTSDSMAVISPQGGQRFVYAGTGSNLGIAAARAVRKAVGYALARRLEHPVPEPPMTVFGRLGLDGMLLDAAVARGFTGGDATRFLDGYFSDPEKVALVDLVLFASKRAASMKEDGNSECFNLISSLAHSVLGRGLDEDCDMMLSLASAFRDDIWMVEPSHEGVEGSCKH